MRQKDGLKITHGAVIINKDKLNTEIQEYLKKIKPVLSNKHMSYSKYELDLITVMRTKGYSTRQISKALEDLYGIHRSPNAVEKTCYRNNISFSYGGNGK